MVKNLTSSPKFFPCEIYLHQILDTVGSYRYMQFQGKLMNLTWENGKKIYFWPDFGPKTFFVSFPSTRC